MLASPIVLLLLVLAPASSIVQQARPKSQPLLRPSKSPASSIAQGPKSQLLEAVRGLNYGVKATKANVLQIEELVADLVPSRENLVGKLSPADAFAELNSGSNSRARQLLSGDWQLLYTSGPDVTSIGKLPGVSLDYVGQTVDTKTNVITNLVRASGWLADTDQEVYVGARRSGPARVELDFSGTKIQVKKVFGREILFGRPVEAIFKPFEIKFDKAQFDAQIKKSGRPTPAFEVIYLDSTLRIQRTSEGYVFIIQKLAAEKKSAGGGAGGGGLGPWLTARIGERGMKALGLVSLTPYIFFVFNAGTWFTHH